MKKQVWQSSQVDQYRLSDLVVTDIPIIEKQLGILLPQSYIDVLLEQNGGYLARNQMLVTGETLICEGLFGASCQDEAGILMTPYLQQEWQLPQKVCVIGGEGPSWFVLDYRLNRGEPVVSYLDTEAEVDIVISQNFVSFIDSLQPSTEEPITAVLPKESYCQESLEQYVKAGDNPYHITAAFLFFVTATCDLTWLVKQCYQAVLIENEFIGPEVLSYLVQKIQKLTLSQKEKKTLTDFATAIGQHHQPNVRKYQDIIIKIIL